MILSTACKDPETTLKPCYNLSSSTRLNITPVETVSLPAFWHKSQPPLCTQSWSLSSTRLYLRIAVLSSCTRIIEKTVFFLQGACHNFQTQGKVYLFQIFHFLRLPIIVEYVKIMDVDSSIISRGRR